MKKLDSQYMFDTEAFVLDAFERFFTYEFYVRYLRSMRREDLHKILELRELIKKKFIELNIISELSECKYSFDDTPEVTYGLDIQLYDLVDWTLDSIQFSESHLDFLCSQLSSMNPPKHLVEHLFTPFNELNDTIEPSLKMLCYRFSDLTSQNDIHFVFEWWCQNLKKYFRDEQNLIGKFGVTSIQQNEFEEDWLNGTVVAWSALPFTAPRLILFKPDHYVIYDSDHHAVSVDGEPLSKSIVLSIQFDADAQNLDDILDKFKNHFYGAQALWYLDQLKSGSYPDFEPRSSKSISDSAIKGSKQNDSLLTEYDSISKYLVGLIFYDAYTQKTEEKTKRDDVAEEIRIKISPIKLHTDETIIQYYYEVRKMINNIDEIIRKKSHQRIH